MELGAEQILPEAWQVVVSWMERENIVARAVAIEALEAQRPRPRKSVMERAAAIIAAAGI